MLKEFKTFREQAELMWQRGISSSELMDTNALLAEMESRLRYVNYYRLAAYWYPFRKVSVVAGRTKVEETVEPGTFWEYIWQTYMFDRRLRQMIFDAISRIEIALRTQLAYTWARQSGRLSPQGRSNCYKNSFKDISSTLDIVDGSYRNSKSEWALFGKTQLGVACAKDLPVWVFVEFTTFGNLMKLLSKGVKNSVVREVAFAMGVPEADFFLSGIKLLHDVRNHCAHQARIWNARWLSKNCDAILRNPTQDTRWEIACSDGEQLLTGKDKTAAVLTFCAMLLSVIAPHSQWKERVKNLVLSASLPYTDVAKTLGFASQEWYKHPLWQ